MKFELLGVKIGNFRSFGEPQSVPLKASNGKVLGFFGQNSAGKSNVIKAIWVFKNMVIHSGDANWHPIYEPFFLSKSRAPSYFEVEITDGTNSYLYGFAFTNIRIVSEFLKEKSKNTNKYRTIFERKNNQIMNTGAANYGFGTKLVERTLPKTLLITKAYEDNNKLAKNVFDVAERILIMTIDSQEIEGYALKTLAEDPSIKEKVKTALADVDGSIADLQTKKHKLSRGLIESLSINDEMKDRLLNTTRFELELKKKYGERTVFFDASEESSGLKTLISVLTVVLKSIRDDRILFIDEFGVYIHPFVAKKIVSVYEKSNASATLVVCSHLMRLYIGIPRTDRVIFTKSNETGETVVDRMKATSNVRRIRRDEEKARNNFGNIVSFTKKSLNNDSSAIR